MTANHMYDQNLSRNAANHARCRPCPSSSARPRTQSAWPSSMASCARPGPRPTRACRRLASSLQRAGIAKNDTVAVMLPNTPAHGGGASYGVPMAGAVLNALNTRLDPETIAFMLDHGEAKAVIVDPEFATVVAKALTLRQSKAPLLLIDVEDEVYGAAKLRVGQQDLRGVSGRGQPQFAWELPGDE